VPEDNALRKTSGRNKDEINEQPRDGLLHNNKLHGVRRTSSIVRIMASRRLRWAGHVSR
jgi:hypothetical protein